MENITDNVEKKRRQYEVSEIRKWFHEIFLWSPYTYGHIDLLPTEVRNHLRKLNDKFNSECYSEATTNELRETFEGRVMDSEISLFLVTGYSGVGKSTYANTVLNRLRNSIINSGKKSSLTIFDVRNKTFLDDPKESEITIIWDKWKNKNKKHFLFIKPIFQEIHSLLTMYENENDTCFRERLKNIDKNYESLFLPVDTSFNEIFNLLNKYSKDLLFKYTYDSTDRENIKENEKESYLYQITELLWEQSVANANISPGPTLKMLLQLFVTLKACELYSPEKPDFRATIAIDNFEHFINDLQLYDKDIVDILDELYRFSRDLDRSWSRVTQFVKEGQQPFSSRFALVVVMRETTELMLARIFNMQQKDVRFTTINFKSSSDTGIFDVGDVLIKKVNFIIKHFKKEFPEIVNFILENKFDKLIESVFSDKSENGLHNAVQLFYSHNIRRVVANLLRHFYDKNLYIDAYLTFNDIANDIVKEVEGLREKIQECINEHKTPNIKILEDRISILEEKHSIYRGGARQIVWKVLLNAIEKSEFLEEIGATDELNSLARRVLTYLLYGNKDDYNRINFKDLLNDVFISPTGASHITNDDIKNLSKVICRMKDRQPIYRWCPLVLVMFNDYMNKYEIVGNGIPSEESFEKLFNDIKMNKNDSYHVDNDNFSIKITVSGAIFMRSIIPVFEYYAVRRFSHKECLPLFAWLYDLKNQNDKISKTDFEEWIKKVDDYIKNITLKVIRKVRFVARNDKEFVKIDGQDLYKFNRLYDLKGYFADESSWSSPRPHPQRVLDSHIRYIDNFRRLVLLEMDEQIKDNSEMALLLEEFSKFMLDIIQRYISELKYFATDKKYISGEEGTLPASKHYYLGGYVRAEQAGSGDVNVAREAAYGLIHFYPFQVRHNKAKEDLLNWEVAVNKKRL